MNMRYGLALLEKQGEKAHKLYDLLSAQGTHYTNFITWMIGDRIMGYSIYYAQYKERRHAQ